MLTVWGRKSSSNVQAVMWCIGELELPYRRIDAGLTHGVNNTAEYLAMNPNGTVPTLRDDDQPPLWESAAILRYLANAYADDEFWPAELPARSNVDRWAEWSKINVALRYTGPIFWRVVRTPPARRDPAAIAAGIAGLTKFLAIADQRLGRHPYLAAQHFTLADIQFGHVLYRYHDIDIERPDLPNLLRYYQMLCERPAYREHVMVSYEELRDTL